MASHEQIGGWAFIIGTVIAIIGGLLVGAGTALGSFAAWIPLVLILLGALVGLLNIADKEVHTFLIAAIALLGLAGSAGGLNLIPGIGPFLVGVVQNLAVFVAPAALIVSVVSIHRLAANKL
ncbi:MAG TPA: hypothetical protein VJG83_04015 [archaeon]|nr:hypothetical protein [archaeon]